MAGGERSIEQERDGESRRGRAMMRTGEGGERQGESDGANRREMERVAGGERWSEQERDGESGLGRAIAAGSKTCRKGGRQRQRASERGRERKKE